MPSLSVTCKFAGIETSVTAREEASTRASTSASGPSCSCVAVAAPRSAASRAYQAPSFGAVRAAFTSESPSPIFPSTEPKNVASPTPPATTATTATAMTAAAMRRTRALRCSSWAMSRRPTRRL